MVRMLSSKIAGKLACIELADENLVESRKDLFRIGRKRIDEIEMSKAYFPSLGSNFLHSGENMAVGAAPAYYEEFSLRRTVNLENRNIRCDAGYFASRSRTVSS